MKKYEQTIVLGISYFFLAMMTEWGMGTLSIWPAAGLSLAGLIVFGIHAWPGIWLGSFFASVMHFLIRDYSTSVLVACLIPLISASGNTIAAVVACKLKPEKFINVDLSESFNLRVSRYLIACICVGFISGFFSISAFYLFNIDIKNGFTNNLFGWVYADLVGIISVTPFLLFMYDKVKNNNQASKLFTTEFAIIILCSAIIIFFIFGPGYIQLSEAFVQPSIIITTLLWASLRTTPLAVASLNLFIFISIWSFTASGYGYFSQSVVSGSETAMVVFLCYILLLSQILEHLIIQIEKEALLNNRKLEETVAQRTKELEAEKLKAEALAGTDPMTGMNNRRAFFSHGKQVEHHAIQYKKTFSVLMIDIDFFKKVNDLYGHDIGDQAIIALANCITQNVRKPDISGRLGGEEFAVIVPESDLITSEKLARRIQENVKKIRITTDAGIVSYNISIGVACQSDQFESLDEILKKSDQALYMAKENGRDCIISYHD